MLCSNVQSYPKTLNGAWKMTFCLSLNLLKTYVSLIGWWPLQIWKKKLCGWGEKKTRRRDSQIELYLDHPITFQSVKNSKIGKSKLGESLNLFLSPKNKQTGDLENKYCREAAILYHQSKVTRIRWKCHNSCSTQLTNRQTPTLNSPKT